MSYVDVFLTKQVMQPYWNGSYLNKRESIGIEIVIKESMYYSIILVMEIDCVA